MAPSEIIERIKSHPFTGLRVHVSDGAVYEVRHPELMLVTKSVVHIALPPFEGKVPTGSVYIDPLHVTRIVPLNGEKSNGRGTGRRKS